MILLLYISFLFYPAFSGFKDAILWSMKGPKAFKWDEHIVFAGERLLGYGLPIVLTFYIAYNHILNWFGFVKIGVCGIASFFFFHDGMQYQGRKWIDKAYPGFFADTKGKNGTFNMPVEARIVLFICATLYVLCYEYYL
jgi:hypothetical protein